MDEVFIVGGGSHGAAEGMPEIGGDWWRWAEIAERGFMRDSYLARTTAGFPTRAARVPPAPTGAQDSHSCAPGAPHGATPQTRKRRTRSRLSEFRAS